jgi:hypothetical protein
MTPELQAVLARARTLAAEEIPRFLGELETIRATVWLQLTATAPVTKVAGDELIDVEEAARRLGVSVDYLYRNHKQFAFTRRVGRKLVFSSLGIDEHIRRTRQRSA